MVPSTRSAGVAGHRGRFAAKHPTTSDAHQGLKEAIATVFAGAWQRCRTHCMSNLLSRVPKSAQSFVATMVRTIYQQPSAEEVWAQHGRVVEQLSERFPEAAALLADGGGHPRLHRHCRDGLRLSTGVLRYARSSTARRKS